MSLRCLIPTALAFLISFSAQAEYVGGEATNCKVSGTTVVKSITVFIRDAGDMNSKEAHIVETSDFSSFLYKAKLQFLKKRGEVSGMKISYLSQNTREREITVDASGKGTIVFGDGFSNPLTCGMGEN